MSTNEPLPPAESLNPAKAPDPMQPEPRDEAITAKLQSALEIMEAVAENRRLLAHLGDEGRKRLMIAAGKVFSPDRADRRRLVKEFGRLRKNSKLDRDENVFNETGIRRLRKQPVFTTPNILPPAAFTPNDVSQPPETLAEQSLPPALHEQNCYICKKYYSQVHHFYDQLCPACADFNFFKRTELADLTGRVALLTGGRVKIGYQAGLKLLRCGAHLIVTTRFPRDSAARYAREPDFEQWGHRLEIFGLDLRHTPSVEGFCRVMLQTRERLDFIVNNACQTVRRPPEFYEHMMEGETAALGTMPAELRKLLGSYEGLRGYHLLPEGADASADALADASAAAGVVPVLPGLTHAAELSQVRLLPEEQEAQKALFPQGRLDQDLQQVDLRSRNSWRMLMAEVPAVELLEVQLVNAVAPFLLNARLKPLMLKTAERDKHIVNVSAVEGQFYRRSKTTRHPHTNMAKAALNMMTRTAATDYQQDGIHMNSVDTGWVTDEDPAEIAERKVLEHRFHPPLDIVDGAARIVDPIITGVKSGQHVWGQFLKDYQPTDW